MKKLDLTATGRAKEVLAHAVSREWPIFRSDVDLQKSVNIFLYTHSFYKFCTSSYYDPSSENKNRSVTTSIEASMEAFLKSV